MSNTEVYSTSLEFSDNELSRILEVLDVKIDSIYDNDNFDKFQKENKELIIPINPSKLERIKQLLPNRFSENENEKALLFYKTMLSIESMNESKITDIHSIPIICIVITWYC